MRTLTEDQETHAWDSDLDAGSSLWVGKLLKNSPCSRTMSSRRAFTSSVRLLTVANVPLTTPSSCLDSVVAPCMLSEICLVFVPGLSLCTVTLSHPSIECTLCFASLFALAVVCTLSHYIVKVNAVVLQACISQVARKTGEVF